MGAAVPDTAKLREQLQLATEDHDTLARIELLRRILDAEPSDAAAHRALIDLWLSVSDYDMAEAALNGWPAAPADVVAITRAKVLRYRDEDLKGAIRTLSDYLAASPKDVTAWTQLVDCLQAAKDYPALLEALNAFIALDRSGKNLVDRANARQALGDFTGAISDARAAQSIEPEADIVKNSLPQFERLEETLKAIPPLDAALAKNPDDMQTLLDRAWWWRYGGVNDRSLADAEAAVKLSPESLSALIAKYRALYLLDRVKSWEARDQTKIDVSKSLALETARAILAADLALSKKPGDTTQLAKRAYSLNEAGQYALARADADEALGIDPKTAAAALEAIFALTMQGSDPAAYFRQLEKADPTAEQTSLANGYIADMYFRQSDYTVALEFAERGLAAQENERLLRVKASCLQRLGRGEEAAAAQKRADTLGKKSQ